MNEWRNELLGVWMPYSEWLPTVGVVQDPHGITHDFHGYLTACWHRWALDGTGHRFPGWKPVLKPVTCLGCLTPGFMFTI